MSDLTNVTNQLLKGKNPENNLPIYIKGLSALYRRISILRFAMNYYMFTEEYMEWSKDYVDGFGDLIPRMEDLIHKALLSDDGTSYESAIVSLRDELIAKMEELTALVDRLQLVQYQCNRAEFRFHESAYTTEYYKQGFAENVMDYITCDPDNQMMQMKIAQVMSELPMRMSTGKFLDRIQQAFTLYTDSDMQSVDDFAYRIRCSAGMLAREIHSKNLITLSEKTESLLGAKISKCEDANIFEQTNLLLEETSNTLVSFSENYLLLADLLNDLLSIEMTDEQLQDANETAELLELIRTLHHIYEGNAELTDDLADVFVSYEGVQESVMRQIFNPESALEEIKQSNQANLEPIGVSKEFEKLMQISRLQSASSFASLQVNAEKTSIAGELYCRKVANELIQELDAYLHEQDIATKRAIMAAVSLNLPLVFHNINEFQEYLINTLGQCSDVTEQYATMNLIHMMMDEE